MKGILTDNKGFSFVEILVAFAIITTSTVAIFSLITQNIQVQKINKDTLTASMLAQEGIELVRGMRDENWLTEGDNVWSGITDGADLNFSIDYNYTINYTPNSSTDVGARLYLNGNNFYDHINTGTPTQFYRLITITSSGTDKDNDRNDDYISVSSEVQWNSNGHSRKYIAETLLYDWR